MWSAILIARRPERNAAALGIDEKIGIQAIERKHPGLALAVGRVRRREFEYIRHRSRLHFHFPPLHRSWVNQIEPGFARYRPRILSHASHTSIAHLRERTGQFIREHH